MKFEINQIGTIFTPFKTKDACPIQGVADPGSKGRVEVFPAYETALYTIESFSHIYLIYIFHRAGDAQLSRSTFLDDSPHGVFASRHPCRPNGIGVSIVKLECRRSNVLEISEIDMLDQTPLIDIKPYVPKFDHRPQANDGWVTDKPMRKKPLGRE